MNEISRSLTLSLTDSLATTPEIPYQDVTQGRVLIPTGSSITSLTWYESQDHGGTFLPAYDYSSLTAPNALAQTVSNGKSYSIPTELSGSRFLKAVANTAGTVYLSMKE